MPRNSIGNKIVVEADILNYLKIEDDNEFWNKSKISDIGEKVAGEQYFDSKMENDGDKMKSDKRLKVKQIKEVKGEAKFQVNDRSFSLVNLAKVPESALKVKIVVVGTKGVGKTAIIRRYVDGIFTPTSKSTIGVDFLLKHLEWSPSYTVNLEVWDVSGQDQIRCMTRAFYRASNAAALVFDTTSRSSLNKAKEWLQDIREYTDYLDGLKLPIVLLANKGDLECSITQDEIIQFCLDNDIHTWCYTSAKHDVNVSKAFHYLIDAAVERINALEQMKKKQVKEKESTSKEESIKLHEDVCKKSKGCCLK